MLDFTDDELYLQENSIRGGTRDHHVPFSIFIPKQAGDDYVRRERKRRRKRGRGEIIRKKS